MKKLKLLVIAVTVLLLALFMFSCEQASAGEKEGDEKTPAKDKIEMAEGEETTVKDDETTSAETTGEETEFDVGTRDTEKEALDTTYIPDVITEKETQVQTSPITPLDTTPMVSEEYKKVQGALLNLDEKTKKEISNALGYKKELRLLELDKESTFYAIRCYGMFNDCIVLFEYSDLPVNTTKTVGEFEFSCSSSFELYVYYNNTLYTLEEAYDKGIISCDNVAKVAENHRLVEEYLHKVK